MGYSKLIAKCNKDSIRVNLFVMQIIEILPWDFYPTPEDSYTQ